MNGLAKVQYFIKHYSLSKWHILFRSFWLWFTIIIFGFLWYSRNRPSSSITFLLFFCLSSRFHQTYVLSYILSEYGSYNFSSSSYSTKRSLITREENKEEKTWPYCITWCQMLSPSWSTATVLQAYQWHNLPSGNFLFIGDSYNENSSINSNPDSRDIWCTVIHRLLAHSNYFLLFQGP